MPRFLALAEKWAQSAHYYNSCGPTEVRPSHVQALSAKSIVDRTSTSQVTIVNTVHLHSPGEFLTIGSPVPNTNVYVLDEDMKPVPIGESGVMWAGGACVSKGYVNLPDKTAERYVRDPFTNDGCVCSSSHHLALRIDSCRTRRRSYMFCTGDLGRWRDNGELEHLGRVDDQVKVKVRQWPRHARSILLTSSFCCAGLPCRA